MRTLFAAMCIWTLSAAASAQSVLSLPRYESSGGQRPWYVADSQWGFVSRFNSALAAKLEGCARADPDVIAGLRLFPSRFGPHSVRGVEMLRECGLGPPSSSTDAISPELWAYVTNDAALPSVMARARAIVFRRSQFTPDYDRTLWDLDRPRYQTSIFTWGPLHATIGDGCTLRQILRRLRQNPSTREQVELAFAEEREGFETLIARGCNAMVLPAIAALHDDLERRDRFGEIFADLAQSPQIRRAYDEYYLGVDGLYVRKFRRYYGLYRELGLSPTEIDFAFILDHAVDTEFPQATAGAILASARGRVASNAALRQHISRHYAANILRGDARIAYRRGRDAAYFIDQLGSAEVSREERRDWVAHSRVRPVNVGLSDERAFVPCELATASRPCSQLWD